MATPAGGAAAAAGGAPTANGGQPDPQQPQQPPQQPQAAMLTQTLMAAAFTADKGAEALLEQWKAANLAELAHALAVEIGAPQRPPELRLVAAIYLKNMLAGKSVQSVLELRQRWTHHVDPASRHRIKQALLASMTSPEPKAASAAALAAAEIAAAELPYEQWNEFVPALMDIVTSTSTNRTVQLAALECLGFAAERMAELEMILPDVPPLSDAVVDKMLTSIVHGMQPTQDPAIRLAAISALRNALGFVRKNMSVKSERDFMIRAICEATQCPTNEKVRELAYSCMDLLAELYYDVLGDYMTVFFQLTTNAIRGGPPAPGTTNNNAGGGSEFVETEDAVKIAAIEFWSTIAYTELGLLEEERDRAEAGLPPAAGPTCPRYTVSVLETLVPLLLEALTKQGDDVDADEWNLQAAGATCLESLSATVEGMIVPAVMPFVQANIANPDWRPRDAAVVAFASIMEGPDTAVIGQYVAEAIPVLLQRFQDPVAVVQDSSVHCVTKICRVHIAAVPPDLLQHVIQALIGKLQEPSALMAAHASAAIYNIALSTKTGVDSGTTIPESNVLSAPMLPLLQALLAAADRDDGDHNLRVSAMSAAAELVSAAARDSIPIFRDFLPFVLTRTEAALQLQVVQKEDAENKEILLGLLCALITVLFQRLDASDVHPHVDRCMTVLLQTFAQRLAVEEALLSVGSVANTMEGEFVKYLSAFMPFLIQGLNSFDAQSLCTVSVGVLVDVCAAVGPAIQPYCDEVMAALRNVLQDSSVTRDIKPVVISAFGDVAMAIQAAYEPYLQISVMMLMQAAQQSAPADDDDLVVFINTLRLSILEAYSGIVIGLADGNALHLVLPHVSEILGFLRFLASPDSNRDEDVLHKAVTLLGDIAQHMGAHGVVRQHMTEPFVAQLINDAMEDPSLRDAASWTQGVVVSVVQQTA